ncbi:MAG: DUF2306 domain-containing protein [Cytophagia bacterium]|nr:DUF2306 domain-containing protein [Cytophagia bacterium]NBW35109.1 DUF2306 domain-containing protein [Cytophagia bacterium]
MDMRMKSLSRIAMVLAYLPFIAFIIFIGLYPLKFFLTDGAVGILTMKSDTFLKDKVWKTFFNTHIIFGGLALLIGWIQFNKYIRNNYRDLHRMIGMLYVFSTWLSVLGIGYISFFAEGGAIAFFGFVIGALIWFYTTIQGYISIRKGLFIKHQQYLIYSYATCLGAATLRIWLPILVTKTGNFLLSYQLVSWISWLPNLIVAYFIIKRHAHKANNEQSICSR